MVSSRASQTSFPGSSASANLGDRSFAPQSGTHIANSRNDNTATHPFAAGPSSHASMSIGATTYLSGVSNGSMTASAQSFSTYQSNDTMIDTPARPKFLTAESIPLTRNGVISKVPKHAPSPRNTYTHPPTNMNQYTGYSSHNPPSLHSSQYRNTATRDNLPPSSSLQVYVHHHHLRAAILLTSALYTGLIYRNISRPTQISSPPTPTLNHSPMILERNLARNRLVLRISQRRLWHPHHPSTHKIRLAVMHTLARIPDVIVKLVHRTLTPRRPLYVLATGLTKRTGSAHFKGQWMIWGSISRGVICRGLKVR
jgi:hypothetical protein